MFKINPSPTFRTEVEIPVPGSEPEKLPITFKHKKLKEIKKMIDEVEKNNADGKSEKNIDILASLIDSWEADETFSKKSFDDLIENYPQAFPSLYAAFLDSYFKAKEGN